jgi:toluene monooxygenase electron transfer component
LIKRYQVAVERPDGAFSCADDDVILRAGLRAGLALAYECNVGGCGSCKFDLLEGEVETLWAGAQGLSDRDKARGRRLACQSRPRGDCRIRMIGRSDTPETPRPKRFQARLVGTTDLTHDLREFRFRSEPPAMFQPGQYALLSLPGVEGLRAYSMSNIENELGEWHFIIRRVPQGAATSALFALPAGSHLEIDGPYGLAFLRPAVERDIICIAGGSGLSPMVSIARGIDRVPALAARTLHFFYGGRTVDDICGEQLLRALPSIGGTVHFHPVVSNMDMRWTGRSGFVHELVAEMVREDPRRFEYYLAGPPAMAEAVTSLLGHEKVPHTQIHFDRFF